MEHTIQYILYTYTKENVVSYFNMRAFENSESSKKRKTQIIKIRPNTKHY
jgi:hypothetical protein